MPPAWRTSPEARRVLTEAIFSTLPIDSIPLSSLGATTDDLLAALAERLAGRLNRHPSAFKLRPADTLGGLLEAVSDLLDDSISTIAEKGEPAALEWPALARANVTALVSCLPPPQPDLSTRPSYDRHVLLSGATSAIGCALLEILMADDAIDKVTCLVSESTDERAMASLLQHLNLSGYDVPRFFAAGVELEVLACDVKAPGWGLRPGDEERLAGGVIDVVAAGWQSDAHESLAGYEVACVRPTLSLLNFCANGRRKTFHWLTTARIYDGPPLPSAYAAPLDWASSDATVAGSSPFVRSQWLMEAALHEIALSDHPVPIIVHRVGDLSAHSRTGHWSPGAAIPRMLRTGKRTVYLPRIGGFSPAWQPPDLVAREIKKKLLDEAESSWTNGSVIDHRRPDLATDWDDYLEVILQLGFCSDLESGSIGRWAIHAKEVGDPMTPLPAISVLKELQSLETFAATWPHSGTPAAGRSRAEITDEVRAWARVWADDD